MSYSIETASRPNLSMLASEDPKSVKMLDAFHKRLGRPESFLTFGPYSDPAFSLHIEKGQTIKEALWDADEDLRHPDGMSDNTPEQDMTARYHVPKLLAHLRLMTPYFAYSIAVGVQAPLSVDQAAEAVAVLEAHPEMLTNGEACRGLDRLRHLVESHSSDE